MNLHLLKDCLGWVATAAFAASYLCKSRPTLLRAQAAAAAIWIAYGLATGSLPVIVTNCATAFMATVYPLIRIRRAQKPSSPQRQPDRHPAYEELPALV